MIFKQEIQIILKVDSKPTYACNMTEFLRFNDKRHTHDELCWLNITHGKYLASYGSLALNKVIDNGSR
jgi:hypothetical protein